MQLICNSNQGAQRSTVAHRCCAVLDHAGAVASSLCAIHCVLCAATPGLLALAGASIALSHEVEWAMVGLALAIGTAAAIGGYRIHRSGRILARFVASGAVILAARSAEQHGAELMAVALAVFGGLLMVSAHLSNRRATGTSTASRVVARMSWIATDVGHRDGNSRHGT